MKKVGRIGKVHSKRRSRETEEGGKRKYANELQMILPLHTRRRS